MGKKKGTNQAYQSELFTEQQKQYDWQPVQSAKKGTIVAIMNTAVTVSAVRQDGDMLYLAFNDPQSGKRTEQLYTHTDSIYVKL